jgi:hypothetical protein
VIGRLPTNQFLFLEPQGDFFLGILNSITSMDDVSEGVNIVVKDLYLPTSMDKSPLMLPGRASAGLVAPTRDRPPLTTPFPSQTFNR